MDVCSGNELVVALAGGMAPERIGFHGNNKSPAELARAVDAGVGRIVVDSLAEIELVPAFSRELKLRRALQTVRDTEARDSRRLASASKCEAK